MASEIDGNHAEPDIDINDSEAKTDSETDSYHAELEITYQGQSADETPESVSLKSLPAKLRSKAFRAKVDNSKSSKSAIAPFIGAVGVDLERARPIGLFNLLSVWLEYGNKYWLNPMDRENGLGVLEEILFKFQGNAQVLSPFVKLLEKIAKNGISPRSFTEYVMLPRMYQDNNWRQWQENHLEVFEIIAGLINSIKARPPFNQEHLGSGETRLARDVVLVRYIGRPLAQFQLSQLSDRDMLDNYLNAWQRISLRDPLSLYFMRNNALHFLYSMSGKIDLVQLIAIIEQLPAIEQAFTSAFPNGINKLETIRSMSLYDYNISKDLHARKQRGFHSLDFTVEIKAYYEIVKTLLEKPAGVYLCAYYAGLLKRYKDPVIADIVSRLIHIIDDRSGMYIYKWHTKKLLRQTKNEMLPYLDYIENCNGCDPEYPQIHLLFRDEEQVRESSEVAELLTEFNLAHHFSGAELQNISYKQLLNAYIKEYPDSAGLITGYQQQLLAGLERQWTYDYLQELDQLSTSLHVPLLRSVIRGIGSGFASNGKSSSFTAFFNIYGKVHSQMKIDVKTDFLMPVKSLYQNSTDQDAIARQSINLVPVDKVWNSISVSGQFGVGNTLSYINKWTMELNKPLEEALEEKDSLEKILKEAVEEKIIKKTEKDIAKQDKKIAALEQKRENYTAIMDEFNFRNDDQKFIIALILAGTAGKTDDEFTDYVTKLFLQRYEQFESDKGLDRISSRLNFLRDDISVDVLSYKQFVYFLNLLETLFFNLSEDKRIARVLEKDKVLEQILTPYLITKKKQVTFEALDAAAKKMTDYASMQAERAKWQGILDKLEQKDEKYFHKMEIYSSKTFIDSYYGDMGGICLSAYPQQLLRPGFFVQRLIDNTDKEIVGMSILYFSNDGFSSVRSKSKNFWQAFAFNPLSSVLQHYSAEQQLYLYLQFRMNIEKIAWMTKMPAVISGINRPSGLISNNGSFGELIRRYECSKRTAISVNANGMSVYYNEVDYADALLIIDPRGHENVPDPSQIPTFYAHRELQNYFGMS